MLYESVYGTGLNVLFVLERLDDLASLRQNLRLNQSLVRTKSVVLLAERHVHHTVQLFCVLVWMRQFLKHVLVRELLVTASSLIALVEHDSLHASIGTLCLQFFDLVLFEPLSFGNLVLVSLVRDARPGPFIPATLDFRKSNLVTELFLDFRLLLLLELLHDLILVFSHKQL